MRAADGERQRLLREIEASRRRLAGDLSGFGHAVNLRERLHQSVSRHPAWWLGGGLLAGWALSKLVAPGRRRPGAKTGADLAGAARHSLFLGLLGLAAKQILRLSEPALKRLAQQEIERWLLARSPRTGAAPPERPQPTPGDAPRQP